MLWPGLLAVLGMAGLSIANHLDRPLDPDSEAGRAALAAQAEAPATGQGSDGEAVTYGRNYGLQAVCNTSRVGFLLQPDVSDGNGFGADLPRRLNRAEFPPGRGFLARGGRVTLAQMAAATSH